MTETYKILYGKYDLAAIPNLTTSPTLTTRGNDLRLQKKRAKYDLQYSLPNDVVHAESTNTFNPDWINFGLISAEIQGTGSRSVIY